MKFVVYVFYPLFFRYYMNKIGFGIFCIYVFQTFIMNPLTQTRNQGRKLFTDNIIIVGERLKAPLYLSSIINSSCLLMLSGTNF